MPAIDSVAEADAMYEFVMPDGTVRAYRVDDLIDMMLEREVPVAAQSRPSNVVQAIARIMAEMPGVAKDQEMDSGGQKYKYRGVEGITAAIQKLMGKYGVVPIPKIKRLPPGKVEKRSGPWVEETLEVFYVLCGPSWTPKDRSDRIKVGPFYGIGQDPGDKGVNKSMTGCLKQMLLQVFVIGEGSHDPDSRASEPDIPRRELTPDEIAQGIGYRSEDDRLEYVAEAKRLLGERIDANKLTRAEANAAWKEYISLTNDAGVNIMRSKVRHDEWAARYLVDPLDENEPFALPHEQPAPPPAASPAPTPDPPVSPSPAPPSAPSPAAAGERSPGSAESHTAPVLPVDNGYRDDLNEMWAAGQHEMVRQLIRQEDPDVVAGRLVARGAMLPGDVPIPALRERLEECVMFEAFSAAPPPVDLHSPEQQRILDTERETQEQARAARRAQRDKG